MPAVVVTDSTACLSPDMALRYGIEVVPTEVELEGRVYRDGVDSPEAFYDHLRRAKKLPKTSAPSPGAFLEAYRRAAARSPSAEGRSREILCITLPAELSSTHQVARQAALLAADELPGVRILCVPTPAVASGQGLVAIETARAAPDHTLDGLAAYVAALASQVHFFAVLDTLEYLARGGHVPRAVGWLGDLVGFKPILTASYGKVERLSQARSREGGMSKMLRLMEERNPSRRPIRALLMHAGAAPECARFRAEIERRFACELLLTTQFTPVMGAHSGPGVVGVAFRCDGEARQAKAA
jgi:DegV family protein with EDD domain